MPSSDRSLMTTNRFRDDLVVKSQFVYPYLPSGNAHGTSAPPVGGVVRYGSLVAWQKQGPYGSGTDKYIRIQYGVPQSLYVRGVGLDSSGTEVDTDINPGDDIYFVDSDVYSDVYGRMTSADGHTNVNSNPLLITSASAHFATIDVGRNAGTGTGLTSATKIHAIASTWSSSTAYAVNDLVTDAGHTYVCILTRSATATVPGSDATHWTDLGAGTDFAAIVDTAATSTVTTGTFFIRGLGYMSAKASAPDAFYAGVALDFVAAGTRDDILYLSCPPPSPGGAQGTGASGSGNGSGFWNLATNANLPSGNSTGIRAYSTTATTQPQLRISRVRGTSATSFSALSSGDYIGILEFMGSTDSSTLNHMEIGAYIRAEAMETWSFTGTKAGTKLTIATVPQNFGLAAVPNLVLNSDGRGNGILSSWAHGATWTLSRDNGGYQSETAILSGDVLGSLTWRGARGTGTTLADPARYIATSIRSRATENWSTTAGGSAIDVLVTPLTSGASPKPQVVATFDPAGHSLDSDTWSIDNLGNVNITTIGQTQSLIAQNTTAGFGNFINWNPTINVSVSASSTSTVARVLANNSTIRNVIGSGAEMKTAFFLYDVQTLIADTDSVNANNYYSLYANPVVSAVNAGTFAGTLTAYGARFGLSCRTPMSQRYGVYLADAVLASTTTAAPTASVTTGLIGLNQRIPSVSGSMPYTGVTTSVSADTFTKTSHGLNNGDAVWLIGIASTTNITAHTIYYVVSTAANTFKLAATPGGTAIDLTGSNGSCTVMAADYTFALGSPLTSTVAAQITVPPNATTATGTLTAGSLAIASVPPDTSGMVRIRQTSGHGSGVAYYTYSGVTGSVGGAGTLTGVTRISGPNSFTPASGDFLTPVCTITDTGTGGLSFLPANTAVVAISSDNQHCVLSQSVGSRTQTTTGGTYFIIPTSIQFSAASGEFLPTDRNAYVTASNPSLSGSNINFPAQIVDFADNGISSIIYLDPSQYGADGSGSLTSATIIKTTTNDAVVITGMKVVNSSGSITTQYGLYVEAQTAGSTDNWGVFNNGKTFLGDVITATIPSGTHSFLNVGGPQFMRLGRATGSGSVNSNILGGFSFRGEDNGANGQTGALIQAVATGTWASSTNAPTRIDFQTASASAAVGNKMVLDQDGNLGVGTSTTYSSNSFYVVGSTGAATAASITAAIIPSSAITGQMLTLNGWINENHTWTRTAGASGVASTFTVAIDVSSLYKKGVRVKWAESSTTKYGVVSADSTFGSGVTTVTLAANTDYWMAANPDALTNAYSTQNPPDYPGWFNWSPTITGYATTPSIGAGGTLTSVTTTIATSLLNKTSHGLVAGDVIHMSGITNTTGITNGTVYYVSATGLTANAFRVAATSGGTAITFGGTADTGITVTGDQGPPTAAVYRFRLDGNRCEIDLREATSGTSATTAITYTLPITAATITNHQWNGAARYVDNGAPAAYGNAIIGSAATTITMGAGPSGTGGFTATGTKRIPTCTVHYEI